ncbi:MAG: LUD domain-containing protein [Actinomycetota bacterium]
MSQQRADGQHRCGAAVDGSSLVERFRAGVVAAASNYHQLADWPAVADHAVAHGDAVAIAPSLAAFEPALIGLLEQAGARVVVPDGADPAAAVAEVPVAIVRGELAIAETGSVLVAEHTLGDRVVTMLCRRLIQVVAAEQLVSRLEDAASWLEDRGGQPGFASLMTGPSRTADIERSLTIGVQGPDHVDVVVLSSIGADTPIGGPSS